MTENECDIYDGNFFAAKEAVEAGKNPIVIDNTNVQAWEMKAYVALVRIPFSGIHLLDFSISIRSKLFFRSVSGKKERLPHRNP